MAMKIRGSRALRNAPVTAKSISVGRFRPVAVSGGILAHSADRFATSRHLAKKARLAGLESATPGLEGRVSGLKERSEISHGKTLSIFGMLMCLSENCGGWMQVAATKVTTLLVACKSCPATLQQNSKYCRLRVPQPTNFAQMSSVCDGLLFLGLWQHAHMSAKKGQKGGNGVGETAECHAVQGFGSPPPASCGMTRERTKILVQAGGGGGSMPPRSAVKSEMSAEDF
jgi:hypothetical protein